MCQPTSDPDPVHTWWLKKGLLLHDRTVRPAAWVGSGSGSSGGRIECEWVDPDPVWIQVLV